MIGTTLLSAEQLIENTEKIQKVWGDWRLRPGVTGVQNQCLFLSDDVLPEGRMMEGGMCMPSPDLEASGMREQGQGIVTRRRIRPEQRHSPFCSAPAE